MSRIVVATVLVSLLWPGAARADEGSKRSEAELLAALANPNYQVRRKAVLAVEGRTESGLLEQVLQMARTDPHPNIRAYTADVLSTFEDPRIFDVLAAMAKESLPGPQEHAFMGLGRHGDPRAYAILIRGLEAGRGRRGYAAKGLGLLGDARAFETIAAAYRKYPDDPYLNYMAPTALVQLDKTRGLAFCRECFVTLPAVARPGLARELGRHASEETRKLMLAQLRSAKDANVRGHAIAVLTQLADPKSADGLLADFRDHPESRAAVAEALGRLEERRAVAPLLAALSEETKGHARNVYIAALGHIGDRRAVRALIGLLDDTGFAAQPRTFSSILRFPWNLETRGAALWAIRTLVDGSAPFDLETLVTFPRRPLAPKFVRAIAELKTWWAAHKDDKKFRIGSD